MNKFYLTLISLLLLTILLSGFLPTGVALAQEISPDNPIYIVQEGDSLWNIALRFGLTMGDLAQANNITDPNQLSIGDQLVIPGLEGVKGILTTRDINFGETLRSLSRRYKIPIDTILKLNHITNNSDLYVGRSLVLPEQNATQEFSQRIVVLENYSLFELAVQKGINPWSLVLANEISGTWSSIPGDVLIQTTGLTEESEDNLKSGPGALPEEISEVNLSPLPMVQGKVSVIQVKGEDDLSIHGSLAEHDLNFYSEGDGKYVSLQGLHAMTEPGLYELTLQISFPEKSPSFGLEFTHTQQVYVRGGEYAFDPGLTVSPETIDPAVTKPEDAQWAALATPATPEKMWTGKFKSPAPPEFSDCWPSLFGNRRSYNGGPYDSFHTGLDFCGGVGTEIYAPATGKVIFAGPLTVRGNATMIDHGWGIYSAYMHQSEILVKTGDIVEPGQLIGRVGGTGRVTGPHLHWEIWSGGVQVDPMDWLNNTYPD